MISTNAVHLIHLPRDSHSCHKAINTSGFIIAWRATVGKEQRRTDQEIQLKLGMSKHNVLTIRESRFRLNNFFKILRHYYHSNYTRRFAEEIVYWEQWASWTRTHFWWWPDFTSPRSFTKAENFNSSREMQWASSPLVPIYVPLTCMSRSFITRKWIRRIYNNTTNSVFLEKDMGDLHVMKIHAEWNWLSINIKFFLQDLECLRWGLMHLELEFGSSSTSCKIQISIKRDGVIIWINFRKVDKRLFLTAMPGNRKSKPSLKTESTD